MASDASHVSHEVFGETRARGSSLARPRAYLPVLSVYIFLAFDCSDKKDGDYDHPSNPCSAEYVTCSGGETNYRNCPSGLVYDWDNNRCQEAEWVLGCGGTNTQPPAPNPPRPPAGKLHVFSIPTQNFRLS